MQRFDVIILGGGLVGLTQAIALTHHGVKVAVIDPADADATIAPGFDGRASAIASASGRLLEQIGVGKHLAGKGCPIDKIWVSDGLAPGALDFAPDEGDGALGTMYENRELRLALRDAAAEQENLNRFQPDRAEAVERDADGVHITLASGATITAPLLIAAEGRNSPTREAARINIARWSYDHVAMITAIRHEKPHNNVAHEIFYPAGPFALLPLQPGDRSAVVWTVKASDAPAMLKLSDRAWLAEMQKRMGDTLGAIESAAPRSSYPLGFHHAARITDTRLALVGDAAHGIHPIAGQGLNLGFRDVAALTQVIVEGMRLGMDAGDAQLLTRYERWRGLDTLMVAASTDGLTRLFGLPGKWSSAIRRFGLSAVQALPPLKARFMAEARGEAGDLPLLLQGEAV